jgi:starch-binding outer membrane protein, SusD/RagB family
MSLFSLTKSEINKTASLLSLVLVIISFFTSVTSCKKLVEIPAPVNAVGENAIFTNTETAIGALNSIYAGMVNPTGVFTGTRSISLLAGLSSDEFTLTPGETSLESQYYTNTLSTVVPPFAGSEHWSPLYNLIFKSNAAIEGLTRKDAEALPQSIRDQLLGEAKFLRALFYFYLVNLYGDVPLAVTTDAKLNSGLARSTKETIYEHMIADLKDAQQLLSSSYPDETLAGNSLERVRPTRWVASALLARVFLYTSEWANAEIEASSIIDNTTLYTLVPLNDVFLKNSQEAIWQLQPTSASFNTQDGVIFIIPPSGPSSANPVFISDFLLNSFDSTDARRFFGNWIDTTIYEVAAGVFDTVAYPFKYKLNMPDENINSATGTANMTEYLMVFRLVEQYLIRAEARAQQGKISDAQSDLNTIRNRAGLSNTTANDMQALLTAVLLERQTELFSEWGNRWLDLKRTENLDLVMATVTPQKSNGASWDSNQQLYPLPLSDLNLMPSLTQNPGY